MTIEPMEESAAEIQNLKSEIAKLKCENHFLRLAYEDEKKKAGKRGRDLIQLRRKHGGRK